MADKEQAFLVQINYKSGISVTMPFTEFSISTRPTGRSISWKSAKPAHFPLYLNVDDIESVFQVGRAR